MHRKSFPVNGVFCAQPQKFSPLKVLPYTVCFFNKTRASVLSLEFRYSELRNIYNKFQEFQYLVVSLFINSGAGLVLSIWFVLAPSIEQWKQFYDCKA